MPADRSREIECSDHPGRAALGGGEVGWGGGHACEKPCSSPTSSEARVPGEEVVK